ncbi:hypothetical protein DM39_40 [Burkholderia cenocepacia]|uniref:Uncharacterized protein n=1 Tax=Burkholderia cenocepacia TaxID=95486 RepID=A0AAN0VLG0_9BURK|nr:hypothetical protein DM39_40 [Burkholderia cenocepacia]
MARSRHSARWDVPRSMTHRPSAVRRAVTGVEGAGAGGQRIEMMQRYAHLSVAHLAQWVRPHLPVAQVIELPRETASAPPDTLLTAAG